VGENQQAVWYTHRVVDDDVEGFRGRRMEGRFLTFPEASDRSVLEALL
jgi:hypothetical protein